MSQDKNHATPDFQHRLREEMRRLGIKSSAELARFAHVGWSTANQWLHGSIPRKLALFDLASRLQVNAEWLETGEGEKEPCDLQPVKNSNLAAEIRNHANAKLEDSCGTSPPDSLSPDYKSIFMKIAEDTPINSLLDRLEELAEDSIRGDCSASHAIHILAPIIRRRIAEIGTKTQP